MRFAEACPEVQIDINVTDEEFDIVAEGYDAGVRLGEVIEQDMIAVPIAGDERQLTPDPPFGRSSKAVAMAVTGPFADRHLIGARHRKAAVPG
jgi:DNA-binding transcriptional LysR family regulator